MSDRLRDAEARDLFVSGYLAGATAEWRLAADHVLALLTEAPSPMWREYILAGLEAIGFGDLADERGPVVDDEAAAEAWDEYRRMQRAPAGTAPDGRGDPALADRSGDGSEDGE